MGSMDDVKKLRELTNLGVMDCKKAFDDAEGDFDKALDILKAKGVQIAQKKGQRSTHEGIIESYIHFDSKKGCMVELACETDFVARTEDVKKFARDLCMHITATDPLFIRREEVTEEVLNENKNDEGQIEDSFYSENCLLEQTFIKDPSVTIKQSLETLIGKIGENIVIKRFVRFEVGKD